MAEKFNNQSSAKKPVYIWTMVKPSNSCQSSL